ncbi:MAG: DUF3990 domain-containing protein [Bacteroidales bacterium]|nr:DUF3990 domain-containing protein [Bacteroidales bacterium]
MKLYHGSLEIVQKPEIRKANRTLDYGSGFYTTTSFEQAEAWVRRRMDETKQDWGYVNVYDILEALPTSLRKLIFQSPTEEWVDFVMRNRTEKGFVHDYDIVYGPVANDRVYAAFALYEGGLLNKQDLIKELRAYKLVDQYLFHTERSLQALTFVEAKEVTR